MGSAETCVATASPFNYCCSPTLLPHFWGLIFSPHFYKELLHVQLSPFLRNPTQNRWYQEADTEVEFGSFIPPQGWWRTDGFGTLQQCRCSKFLCWRTGKGQQWMRMLSWLSTAADWAAQGTEAVKDSRLGWPLLVLDTVEKDSESLSNISR